MFILPELPYAYNALEPYIDETTMRLHHNKHHAGYVEKLNKALEGTELLNLSIQELFGSLDKVPEGMRQLVINNGGGHANHSLFWETMNPGGSFASIELKSAIDGVFGNFDTFKEKFTDKALSVFGSGWVFLVPERGNLIIKRHSFQNSPLLHGNTPILGLDVWEHAYYLKYQNRRSEYVEAWWNVVNWRKVSETFAKQ